MIGGDADQLDPEFPEPTVLLQIYDLLDARRSPRAHAEVEERRTPGCEALQRHF